MADASLNVKMVADTTQLKSGLADAARAAEQFAQKGRQIAQAGTTMSNGLKQVGTAASGLKGKLGGFASEMAYFVDEIAAGVGPVESLASRIPMLVRGLGALNLPMIAVTTAASIAGPMLVKMGLNALTASQQVKSLDEVGKEIKTSIGDWITANKALEQSFTQLGNTSNAAALQFRRGFVNEMGLARQQVLDGFKQLPVALGAEMLKFKGTFDPVVNVMKDLSPWVQKALVGFKTLGGSMQAATPQAQGLVNTLQGLKSLGASQQQLDSIAIAINNLNKAAQSKDPQVYAAALQDVANRLAELLAGLGVAPGRIQALVKEFYAGADAAGAMAGQVSKLTQTLIDLAKARNAVNSAGMSMGGFMTDGVDLAVRKYTDLGEKIKQQRADMEGFWTSAKTGADKAAKAVLDTYVPAQDRIKQRITELEKARATLGINATAEDLKNFNAGIADLNGQLDKLASGGGGGGGGGGSLGRAAKGIKAVGDGAKAATAKLKEVNSAAAEWGQAMQSIAQSLGSGIVDALFSIAEGSQSAKEAFGQLAKSMLRQLAQIAMQLLVIKPLLAMLGMPMTGGGGGIGLFAGGGATRGFGPSLQTMPRNTLGNYQGFGASPSVMQAMRSSISTSSSAAPSHPIVNVKVENNSNAQVKTRQEGNDIYIRIEEFVAEQLVRGGGKIAAGLERGYGVRRVGY